MGRKTNDWKEGKLNWPLSVLYLEFHCLETNKQYFKKSTAQDKQLQKVDCYCKTESGR